MSWEPVREKFNDEDEPKTKPFLPFHILLLNDWLLSYSLWGNVRFIVIMNEMTTTRKDTTSNKS